MTMTGNLNSVRINSGQSLLKMAIRMHVKYVASYMLFEHPSMKFLQPVSLAFIEKFCQTISLSKAALDLWQVSGLLWHKNLAGINRLITTCFGFIELWKTVTWAAVCRKRPTTLISLFYAVGFVSYLLVRQKNVDLFSRETPPAVVDVWWALTIVAYSKTAIPSSEE